MIIELPPVGTSTSVVSINLVPMYIELLIVQVAATEPQPRETRAVPSSMTSMPASKAAEIVATAATVGVVGPDVDEALLVPAALVAETVKV